MAPRVPFDVLLNRDSKRKTSSVVTLRGTDERLVGTDAAALATKLPRDAFVASKLLLGRHDAHGQAALHGSLFGANALVRTDRGTTAVGRSNASLPQVTAEELVAMQFAYAGEMAKLANGGDKVADVVVTVPAFYDQFERRAVLDAIELAHLRPIALVNDGTAVAVQYAVNRAFPTAPEKPEIHLFYDAGAVSTRVTVASFVKTAATKDAREATEVSVLGVGSDRLLGGLALDALIRDMLVADFKRERPAAAPIERNERAMAKLLKEAARVKHVLSANLQSPARIEGLVEDTDFRSMVTREQLEAACAERGLEARFAKPIQDALDAADLTIVRLPGSG